MSQVSLPNSRQGATTETIGLVAADAADFVAWLVPALGHGWKARDVGTCDLGQLASQLSSPPGAPLTRRLIADVAGWTAIMTDGPEGTDVGLLPFQAARDLQVAAVRATAVDEDSESYAASIFEVFDHRSDDPLLSLRHVFAAHDGGRWQFGQSGSPLPFECEEAYAKTRIRDRLTPTMVRAYVEAFTGLRISLESEVSAFMVESSEP